jgi:hypothetical protein
MELLERLERLDPVVVVHASSRIELSIISTFREFSKRGRSAYIIHNPDRPLLPRLGTRR